MINFLRNIVTAIWCAGIAAIYGFFAFVMYSLLRESEPYISITNEATIAAVFPFALVAVAAGLALLYVPILTLVVISSTGAGIWALSAPQDSEGSIMSIASIHFAIAVISFGLVFWDIKHRQHVRSKRAETKAGQNAVREF